jgi:UDP-N-acetyl-D-galactosamine dehydrogenase
MNILQANILVMGITFKENCPDTRNSKIIDLIKKIKEFCPNVDVHDSWADKNEVKSNYNINLIDKLDKLKEKKYDVIIFAVAHNEFKKMSSIEIGKLVKKNHIIYDLKYLLDSNETNYRL